MIDRGSSQGSSGDLSAAKRALLEQRLRGRGTSRAQAGRRLDRRPDNAPRCATLGQQTIWLLDQSSEPSHLFNITSGYRVGRDLDLSGFEASVKRVITRHEILRSSYRLVGDRLEQQVSDRGWGGLERVEVEEGTSLEEAAQHEVRKRLDPEKGPLLRLLHLSHGEGAALLVLLVHHLIVDEWSIQLFWKEVCVVYNALERGEAPDLPELDAQFDDFAHWQRETLSGSAREHQLAYWKQRLSDLPEPIPLPVDRPYPTVLSYRGRLANGRVSAHAMAGLRRLASEESASLFAAALLAYQILLQRLAQIDDVLVAVPVTNRRLPETASMIGFFLHSLPIRTNFGGNVTVREALRQVRQSVQEALQHQDLPLDHIASSVKPPHIAGRHPLAQVMFVFQRQSEAEPALNLGSVSAEPILIENQVSKFDLTLFLTESDGDCRTLIEYRTDLFEHDTVERWLHYFSRVIETMAAGPDRTVAELDFLLDSERSFGRGEDLPDEADFHDVLSAVGRIAQDAPTNTAVIATSGAIEYGELWRWAGEIARQIRECVVGEQPLIALYLPKSMGAIAGILGILRAGGAYVPVDPAYPEPRNRTVLADAGVSAILTSEALAEAAGMVCPVPVIVVEAGPRKEQALEWRDEKVDTSSLAYVIYTSGSTGTPKGVEIAHQSLRASTLARREIYGASPGVFLLLPSLSFDSSVAGLFWTLSGGGTLVVPTVEEPSDPGAIARLIRTHGVTTSLAIPGLWQEILAWATSDLGSMRTMIVAGETCLPALVRRHMEALPRCELWNEYGPTEATVWATVHRCESGDGAGAHVPIGTAIPGSCIHLLDRHGRPVGIGIVGDLWIGGATVARGYRNQPDLTAERFRENPGFGRCYRTGDRARWRKDGTLEFLGRGDRQVKLRGFRIELDEIETVLTTHPGVAEGVAVVEPTLTDAREAESVIARLAGRLPDEVLTRWIREIQTESSKEPSLERQVARDAFRLSLEVSGDRFVDAPRKAQRDWLLSQAMNEFADDLEHLDRVAGRFVPGNIRDLKESVPDIRQAQLSAEEIMEDWQVPLMRAMAEQVTTSHGDVLEIGFGRGVAAEFIQQGGVRSHSVVEMNDHSVNHYFQPFRQRHAERDIRLFHGRWQDLEPSFGKYDGILFHAFPVTEEEFIKYILESVTFAEHAFPAMAAHLREGGVFTYLSTEIDSLSRRHQRALFRHFRSLSLQVEPVTVPENTHDAWWADSMVVIKAVK